jgi:hypothetical protein
MIQVVNTESKSDRRRPPKNLSVQITQLPYLGAAKGKTVAGRIYMISSDGILVITSSALPESALLRCDISIGRTSIHIPTLMQVHATEKQKSLPNKFCYELSFLL